jgi:uncharacterized Zn finger protein
MPERSACRGPVVSGWGNSVTDLVTRFALRSRADKSAYDAGTRLAEAGAVRFAAVAESRVSAVVDDGTPFDVALAAQDGALLGSCSCSPGASVCRHAVAVAHALWLADADAPTRPPRPRSP